MQKYFVFFSFFSIMLISCTSNPPAPVIDRAPTNNQSAPKPLVSPTVNDKSTSGDWRPKTYTVKKGDTLYAIGLEFGYDYRDIAAANNIAPPYQINIGQKLSLPDTNGENGATNIKTSPEATEDGVVVTPIQDIPVATKPTVSPTVTPVLSEPKAYREPYSQEAFNQNGNTAPVPNTTRTAETSSSAPNVTSSQSANIQTTDDESIRWAWPADGKIISRFNEGSNKGIDIDGKEGQPVLAASAGKVIYSGSDLRGYGKLVIIKHNKTYLSVYAHNNKLLVKEGQLVSSGQKIAEMGNTDSNRVKLHFEIRRQGKSVDPASYLPKNQ